MPVYQLPEEPIFPDPSEATEDGLLAVGGDLSPQRLVAAYASGIFPWYNSDDPILWWSPDPRMIIYPEKLKVSKSLKRNLRKSNYEIRVDTDFAQVIENCKKVKRKGEDGTWISNEMFEAYVELHKIGIAHSIEVWDGNDLVGGLYGLSIGKAFYGESMFQKRSDASKIAFFHLCEYAKVLNFEFIDCQIANDHLISLGAEDIPREYFLEMLNRAVQHETSQGSWEDITKAYPSSEIVGSL